MEIIKRKTYELLKDKLQPGKVLLLYGPRRVGKTTIVKQFAKDHLAGHTILFLNGEIRATQEQLSSQSLAQLKTLIDDHDIIIIDEAQHIPQIGLHLKLLIDHFSISIIATGSASFALSQQVGEPLTGRKKTIRMFPVSAQELVVEHGSHGYLDMLEELLVYGAYPEVLTISGQAEKKEYLSDLTESYLLRDILELDQVRNPKKLRDLLTLLAWQIGKEVSLSEIGNQLDLNKATVFRYLDLLEQAFVIINIRGFSRNLRKEVTKTSRYYFYDTGIRNALINNFNPLSLRNDVGMLWENYLAIERIKKQAYSGMAVQNYFWRTYDQKEIDWVEERDGKLYGYEFSWQAKSSNASALWQQTYAEAEFTSVYKNNCLEFIG